MSTAVVPSAARIIEELLSAPQVQTALGIFESESSQITEEQIRIASIPSPPFGEAERATYFCNKFQELGLTDVQIDTEGNVLALRSGKHESPLLVISAHLDTVFPSETDFSVRRLGNKLLGPGISDDACGLVALVALAHALQHAKIQTVGSMLFVATVGEEGEGNLRGVRHLFSESQWRDRIAAFLSFDGSGIERITNRALGSRRYRVQLTGSGGHSWGDFGVANPVHALGRAIAKLASYPLPNDPKSTFNVGRVEGGSSINAIPEVATMDVDLRSVNEDELLRLDAFFRRAVREATDEENAARRKRNHPLQLNLKLIGERPSGQTSADDTLVQLALEATRSLGFAATLDQASTDSNLPISLGKPAITLGAGGTSGNSHTLAEWYDPTGREHGLKRGLLVALGMVGIDGK
jgi:acetylornithine deacetylase/succinyl-diaminopimelate desuccinylase-like protein